MMRCFDNYPVYVYVKQTTKYTGGLVTSLLDNMFFSTNVVSG